MKNLTIVVILVFMTWGCNKNDTNPVVNLPSGILTGSVEVKYAPSNNNSGVLVSLEGTNLSTTSASDGKWTIKNVPEGIFTITFSKPGYFFQQFNNFQFVDKDSFNFSNPIIMAPIPPYYVNQLKSDIIDSTKTIIIQGSISSVFQKPQGVYVLIAKNILPDTKIIQASKLFSYGASSGQYSFLMYTNSTDYSGFSKGDTLQAVAYVGDDAYSSIIYYQTTGYYEFNTEGVKLSNIISFVIP